MIRKDIPVNLDLDSKNIVLTRNLLQGNEDINFKISLTRGNVLESISPSAKITVVCIYGLETHYDKNLQKEVETNKGNYVLAPGDTNYNVTVASDIITVPVTEMITNVHGKNQFILHVEDGINAFTYNMIYYVDENLAYTAKATPNNLPTYESLKKTVDAIKAANDQNTQDITQIKSDVNDLDNEVTKKANNDLSNVQSIQTIPDGNIVNVENGVIKDTGININRVDKIVDFPYSIQTLPNTIKIGTVDIHENGNFLENETLASGKKYLFLDYENDPDTGTKRPVYYARGVKRLKQALQGDSDTVMNNVSSAHLGLPTYEHQTQSAYFKFTTDADNFRFKVVVGGNDIEWYPSKRAYNATTAEEKAEHHGYDLKAGDVKIDLEPWWSSLSNYDITLVFKADNVINMLGNGTLPYIAIDDNVITRYDVALTSDIQTPQEVVTEFTKLTDTPASYTGQSGKIIKVNDDEDALEFFDMPSVIEDPDKLSFKHSFGIKATNSTGNIINAKTFVFLSPKSNGKYDIIEINKTTGYNGELFGVLDEDISSGTDGIVSLITNYQTTVTTANEGEKAYIGFANNTQGDNTITIGKQSDISLIFGSCGVFGKANQIGEYMATFECFKVQSNYFKTDDIDKIQKELDRINVLRNQKTFSGTFKGDLTNVIDDSKAYHGYFITTFAVDGTKNSITLPNHADIQEGTVFSIDNQDINDSIKIIAPAGILINGVSTSVQVPSDNILFLIRAGDTWKTGFSGFMPDSMQRILADVKIAYPNIGQSGSGLTIEEIENKLADRLKTTSQIAQEFKDQLHTIPQLVDAGIANQYAEYGFVDNYATAFGDFHVEGTVILDHTTDITSPNKTSYLCLRIPEFMSVLIDKVHINGVSQDNADVTEGSWGNKDYYFWSFPTAINANTDIKLHFNFLPQLSDKIHTKDEILSMVDDVGYQNNTVHYGWVDDVTTPTDNNWIQGDLDSNKIFQLTSPNQDKHLAFIMPAELSPLLLQLKASGTNYSLYSSDYIYNGLNYKYIVTRDLLTANKNYVCTFDFEIVIPTDDGISVVGDDPTELNLGIQDLAFTTSIVEVDPDENDKAIIRPYINAKFPLKQSETGTDQEFKSTSMKFLTPLNGFSDPDEQLCVIVEVDHNAYEPQHNSGFLAYMSSPIEIMGKNSDAGKYHRGAIFPDNIIIDADGRGIQKNKSNRTFGIQEYDGKDPNITGGTDFLVCARVSFEGKAQDNGFIRVMLANANLNPLDEDTIYLKDVNNTVVASERQYYVGEKLDHIDLMAVVNATGLKQFKFIIVSSLDQDIYTTEKYDGITGIMIQSLSSTEKSGIALTQYELDAGQDINYTAVYMGDAQRELKYTLEQEVPTTQINAGDHYDDIHHFDLHAVQTTTIAVKDVDSATPQNPDSKTRAFEAEGTDFVFKTVFDAYKTKLLHNKQIQVTVNMQNQQTGYYLSVFKWIGKPNEYTDEIYTSRNVSALNLDPNWKEIGKKLINVNASEAFYDAKRTFDIPDTANNIAVAIYPELGFESASLRIHDFAVNVVNPFIGYALHLSKPSNSRHLEIDREYKRLVQDTQGYKALKYTNNSNELPMPCGVLNEGLADISIDSTVNTISGSVAKGGEGAIKFNREGKAIIKTSIRLWSEQANNTSTTVRYWYGKLHSNGLTYDKIVDSESSFLVGGGAQNVLYHMKPFSIDVKDGDRIVLRSEDQKDDGSFLQCTSDDKPMIDTHITFDEITTEDYLDSKTEELKDNLIQLFTADDFTTYRDSMKFSIDQTMPNDSTTFSINFTGIDDENFPRIVGVFRKNSNGKPLTLDFTQRFDTATKVMDIAFKDTIKKDEEFILFGEVWVQ